MDNTSTLDQSGGVERTGNSLDTSNPPKSRKSAKMPITPEVRLGILQQAAFDCKEAGFVVKIINVEGGAAIVVLGSRLENGDLVPIQNTQTANTE